MPTSRTKVIILKRNNQSYGRIELLTNGEILCYDSFNNAQKISPKYQTAVKCLIKNLNIVTIHEQIATAVNSSETSTKIFSKLPYCIKESCETVHGTGYILYGEECNATVTEQYHSNLINGMKGIYSLFYLDPNGRGITSGFLELTSSFDNTLTFNANCILGVFNNEFYLDSSIITKVFRSEFPRETLRKFRDGNKKLQGAFIAEGTASLDENLNALQITLQTPINAKWNISLDLTDFITRCKNDKKYSYKGGIGLCIALTPSSGNYFVKLGAIRHASIRSEIDIPKIEEMLFLKNNTTINIDNNESRVWYNSFL